MATFWRAYKPSKSAFAEAIEAVQRRKEVKVTTESCSLGMIGPEREDLSMDSCVISRPNDSKLLLITTGVHGCELYAGSAVVRHFLTSLASENHLLPRGISLAVVHAVNPFGAAWARRENINNVDLNRNFLPEIQEKSKTDLSDSFRREFYRDYGEILDCSKPVSFRTLRTLGLLLKFGEPKLANVLTPGQRQFPSMLFYGGNVLQEEILQLARLVNTHILSQGHPYKEVVHLDIHTGIGSWGKSTIIVSDENGLQPVQSRQGIETHVLGEKGFPLADGALITNFPRFLHNISEVSWQGLIEEYGTYGKTRIYLTQVPEHIHYHKNSAWLQAFARMQSSTFHPDYLSAQPKLNNIDVFCPLNPAWEQSVLSTGRETLRTILQFLASH